MFSVNGIDNHSLNLTERQMCFLSIEWYQECSVIFDLLLILVSLQSVVVLELSLVFSGAYKVNILRILYRSVDTHCILFRVEFEDGSSVSVLRNRATCYKKFTAGNRRFLKRSNACPLTFFSYPAFSKPMSHPPWQAQNTMITAAGSKMRHCVWGNYGGSRISANEKIKDGRSWKYRNLQVSYFFLLDERLFLFPFIQFT
jgi:hypothetical protein